jgi:oligoribonuclease NrnB/cAMP/cGMP phosphodiesterase (DHH superfamily)
MRCFYHSDLDGKCSAAIVLRSEPDCKLVPVDYRDRIPIEEVEADEEVIIVDFSLQSDADWKRLLRQSHDIVWIDHHESAIKKAEALGIDQLPGIRKIGESGCLLTWKWFHGDVQIPRAVEIINQWDLWTHNDDPDVLDFIFGLKLENTHPASRLWESIFSSEDAIAAIQRKGRIVEPYDRKRNRAYLHKFAFEADFEGHRCLACNVGLSGSRLFDSMRDRGYDIFITFVYDGEKHSVYLFSDTVKVNTLAEKYGGGGHAGAAGFTCRELPFAATGKIRARPRPSSPHDHSGY